MGNTAKNTAILPDFLVLKFCGKAQFPHSFGRIAGFIGDSNKSVKCRTSFFTAFSTSICWSNILLHVIFETLEKYLYVRQWFIALDARTFSPVFKEYLKISNLKLVSKFSIWNFSSGFSLDWKIGLGGILHQFYAKLNMTSKHLNIRELHFIFS